MGQSSKVLRSPCCTAHHQIPPTNHAIIFTQPSWIDACSFQPPNAGCAGAIHTPNKPYYTFRGLRTIDGRLVINIRAIRDDARLLRIASKNFHEIFYSREEIAAGRHRIELFARIHRAPHTLHSALEIYFTGIFAHCYHGHDKKRCDGKFNQIIQPAVCARAKGSWLIRVWYDTWLNTPLV